MTLSAAALIIFISALSGWCLVRILLWLIFHPYKPVNIFGLKLQGAVPAQQQTIARAAGKAASNAFSLTGIAGKISSPDNFQKLKPELEVYIDHFLNHKLKEVFPMLSMFIGEKTISQFKQAFLSELEQIFPQVMARYADNLQQEINPEALITAKIGSIPVEQLETAFNQLAGEKLKKLQVAGAIFGTAAGLLQAALLALLLN